MALCRAQLIRRRSAAAGRSPAAWVNQVSAADNAWGGIAFGAGVFVAVCADATGQDVMTSPDGKAWTLQTTPAGCRWTAVTYGGGLFVAVGYELVSGVINGRVMTSPDGETWTLQTAPTAPDATWRCVTYGGGLFVAGSSGGFASQNIMTSPDAVTWTLRTIPAARDVLSIAYGASVYVATATTVGSGDPKVLVSSDATSWTEYDPVYVGYSSPDWVSVAFGPSGFVAVTTTGSGSSSRVITSSDGDPWTAQAATEPIGWTSITYSDAAGLLVAVGYAGTTDWRVMSSSDGGSTWRLERSPLQAWGAVAYGAGVFCAVAFSGAGNRVMTSKRP